MTAERYTLDANILFYALDAEAERKHIIAKQLLEGAFRNQCVLTLQALAETYHAISRKKPQLAEETSRILEELAEFVPVIAADVEVFALAMESQLIRKTQFWDTMLWATAKKHGCRTILSEDTQDRPEVDGVDYIDPFHVPPLDLAEFL